MVSGWAFTLLLATLASPSQATRRPDPLLPLQWNLDRIQVQRAWSVSQGDGTTIAVIDSGVDFRHEDLRGRVKLVFGKRGGICAPRRARCGAAEFDPEGSHGTFVASVAAAKKSNGRGIAGVAPKATLLAAHYDLPLARVIKWAALSGADVINLSLRLGVHEIDGAGHELEVPSELERAFEIAWRKGALIVASASNELMPFCGSMHTKVMCVGALDAMDARAWYSNFGAGVHIWAPGGTTDLIRPSCDSFDPVMGVHASIIGAVESSGQGRLCGEDGYSIGAGTSFAAPHVSGVAALLFSKGMTNRQVWDCLVRTSDDLGSAGFDPLYHASGRVNASRAVSEC